LKKSTVLAPISLPGALEIARRASTVLIRRENCAKAKINQGDERIAHDVGVTLFGARICG
jgi:hypothetical protein